MNRVVLSIVSILLIAVGCFVVIKVLKKFAPEAELKERVVKTLVVKTKLVARGDVPIVLTSEGLVETRRDTILSAQVGGKIVEVDPRFEAGAAFAEDEMIARIDPVDYETAVAQAASTLAEANLALVQEQARADQAKRDWEKIGGGKEPTDLVLRVPFLKSAKARVTAAKASLRRAEEDLERTVIKAPFACRVRAVTLNLGATVMPGSQLGTIYDDENLLIRLPLSLTDYASLPDVPVVSLNTTIGGTNYEWQGEVLWDLGEVDQETSSAYVLVRLLPNEEGPARFRLPLAGTFLNARLEGAVLKEVVGVPRQAVRGRDEVFVLNSEGTLEERKLVIARSTAEMVYVTSGIESGAKVILTKIEMPFPGMSLEEAAEENDQPRAE